MLGPPIASSERPGYARLALAIMVIAVVWTWGLPWLAQRPQLRRQLQFLDSRGIDPSAMYYTELELMKEILHRIERTDGGGSL